MYLSIIIIIIMPTQTYDASSITRREVRSNPDKTYVFEDDLLRMCWDRQARAMRGEPNAVGVPVRVSPISGGRLADTDRVRWRRVAIPALDYLCQLVDVGRTVVLPSNPIGTSIANLERDAPSIWAELNESMCFLEIFSGE
jgi:hypothetical protein